MTLKRVINLIGFSILYELIGQKLMNCKTVEGKERLYELEKKLVREL